MKLNQLANKVGATKSRKRVGRGIGSGMGKTCTRGHKGQKSRSGVAIKGFEGGQQALYRRLPKRGFFNKFRTEYESVNLNELQREIDRKKIDATKDITREVLAEVGLVRKSSSLIKLLAKGELKVAVTVEADSVSSAAKEAIEKAGGKVTLPAAE